MLSLLLGIVALALRLATYVLLAYCIMSFVAPQNDLYRKASMYIEPVLQPIRQFLWKWIPPLRRMPVDFSPLALWLAIDVLTGLVNLLRRVF